MVELRVYYIQVHLLTCTSKVKYFFRFFIIMTRKGSLIPSVFFGSAGHVIYVVLQKEETLINTPVAFSSVGHTTKTRGPRGKLESRSRRSRHIIQLSFNPDDLKKKKKYWTPKHKLHI